MEQMVSEQAQRRRIRWNRIFCLLIAAAFLLSLLPLLVEAKYNLPISDDITVIAVVEQVWDETHSVSAFLNACIEDGVRYYNTWQGTYTANFLVELLDVLLLRQYPMLTPVLSILMLTVSMLVFGWVLIRKVLEIKGCTWLSITVLALILMMQFCPSAYEAFYWLFAMLLYTWSYGFALLLTAGILAARRTKSTVKKVLWYVLALFSGLYIGGGTQVVLPAMALILLYDLICCIRSKQRLDTVFVSLLLALHLAGTILNVTAPGNFARLDFETGAAAAAMSPVRAILLSCVHGFGEVLNRLDPGMLLFMLAVAVLCLPGIRESGFSFKRPWLAMLLSFGVYASLFTALLYTKNHVGPLRVQNLYYFALYPLMGFNTIYWLGAALRSHEKRQGNRQLPASASSFLSAVYRRPIVTLLIAAALAFAVVVQQGITRTWSYAAYQDLSSGWARDYYAARLLELNGTDPTATQNVVRPNIINEN